MLSMIMKNHAVTRAPGSVPIQDDVHVLAPIAGEKPETEFQWSANDLHSDLNDDLEATTEARHIDGGIVFRVLILVAGLVGIFLVYQVFRVIRRKLKPGQTSRPHTHAYGLLNNQDSSVEVNLFNASEDPDDDTLFERN